ncbi:MAG: ribonuclease PH [Polyangiaceae bacterium]|nr:ribonuclease PH [Polyangiaceae bacterium]
MNAPARVDRGPKALRPVQVVPGFHSMAEGSVLYRSGRNVVLVTASVDESVPEFMRGQGIGWVTAEYQMHPRSNPTRREKRDGRERPLNGRSKEIERLVGRALRSAVRRDRLGERSVVVDCDVLEADGGTRTACITGGWVALALALDRLKRTRKLPGPLLRDQVAAVSAGYVAEELLLDLCYAEDSVARFDLNVVATGRGEIVELQGTAEGAAMPRSSMDAMVTLALEGISELCTAQRDALSTAGVALDGLLAG